MKVVIELSDKIYDTISYDEMPTNEQMKVIVQRIYEGTPLPKGHGDLKDIGKCDRKLFYQQCGGANSLITVKTAFDMLLSLPTIIEADNVESEGKE